VTFRLVHEHGRARACLALALPVCYFVMTTVNGSCTASDVDIHCGATLPVARLHPHSAPLRYRSVHRWPVLRHPLHAPFPNNPIRLARLSRRP
jgi:hypothetical protein